MIMERMDANQIALVQAKIMYALVVIKQVLQFVNAWMDFHLKGIFVYLNVEMDSLLMAKNVMMEHKEDVKKTVQDPTRVILVKVEIQLQLLFVLDQMINLIHLPQLILLLLHQAKP